mmetsp:Transcript_13797/g.20553  ORF Transcript_13797/g.20553 Transcript_13797/m.20553 type:complete len:85 (-) Transcript_13797:336-590(-)
MTKRKETCLIGNKFDISCKIHNQYSFILKSQLKKITRQSLNKMDANHYFCCQCWHNSLDLYLLSSLRRTRSSSRSSSRESGSRE